MKKIPFSRSAESLQAYPYSTCRQVEMSFLGMPQIAHFQVEKWKSSLPWEGGPPTPYPRSVATLPSGLVASLPRKDCAPPPPQMFWLITPLVDRNTFVNNLGNYFLDKVQKIYEDI